MPAVNRVPPALASLLDIKGGDSPRFLAETIAPTLDLVNFYANAQTQTMNGSTAAIAAVGIAAFVVSLAGAGEVLYIEKACVFANALGAGTSIRYRFGVYDIALAELIWVGPATSGAATERPCAEVTRPLIVQPGQGLCAFVEALTLGVAPTLRFSGSVARLRV